ncbi:Kiwa anti-phage protein KwaB-like domain-containing protein [Bacillus sp. FSL R5-0560]|uniref:Kiwa anti-phage protein KwaB-like domain-containing protein n=1 Tax=Bacillus TaxID=1386 RepID=UPI0030D56659
MNIQELITILNNTSDDEISIRLYFTRKKQSGRYTSYSPGISVGLQKNLKEIVLNALNRVRDTEQREFSPIGVIDETIETTTVQEVNSYKEIMDSVDEEIVKRGNITSKEIGKFNFYILKINIQNYGDLWTFRRVTKFNRLKHGLIGRIADGDFEKLEPNLLGIDENLDIIIFNDDILILNHISLERIFSIYDQYTEKATETLNIVERAQRITNFDQFKEDCLADKRVTRALTKILNEEQRINQCFENFENVIKVVDIFELEIEFEEGNTALIYEDKSQLMDITRLIRDSFYETVITGAKGVDEGV